MAEQQIKKTAVRLVAAAVAMFGFGYALVPLYAREPEAVKLWEQNKHKRVTRS